MFSHKTHMNHLFYQVIPLTCDSKISMWSNNERLGPNSQKICRRFLFCCQQVLSYRSLLHHIAKLHFWGKYQYHMFLPCLFIQCRFHLSNAYLFKYKSISSCFIEITTPHDKQQKPYVCGNSKLKKHIPQKLMFLECFFWPHQLRYGGFLKWRVSETTTMGKLLLKMIIILGCEMGGKPLFKETPIYTTFSTKSEGNSPTIKSIMDGATGAPTHLQHKKINSIYPPSPPGPTAWDFSLGHFEVRP